MGCKGLAWRCLNPTGVRASLIPDQVRLLAALKHLAIRDSQTKQVYRYEAEFDEDADAAESQVQCTCLLDFSPASLHREAGSQAAKRKIPSDSIQNKSGEVGLPKLCQQLPACTVLAGPFLAVGSG